MLLVTFAGARGRSPGTRKEPAGSEPRILRRDTGFLAGSGRTGPDGPQACGRWFVELYSDYRDDRLDEETRAEVVSHIAECAACCRYDRVIRKGVGVLRDSFDRGPRVLVDRPREQEDLKSRLAASSRGPAVGGVTAAAILLVIALNAFSAWSPQLGPVPPDVEIAPVAAVQPSRPSAPAFFPMPPLLPLPLVGTEPVELDGDRFLAYRGILARPQVQRPVATQVDPD